jgi:hypothetical protein
MVNSTPRPLYLREGDPVPIVQEAGWAPGPVWKVLKISPPPGFDPRTVQLVASRYTDWAIAAHNRNEYQGVKAAGRPYHLHVPIVYKSVSLNLLEP